MQVQQYEYYNWEDPIHIILKSLSVPISQLWSLLIVCEKQEKIKGSSTSLWNKD